MQRRAFLKAALRSSAAMAVPLESVSAGQANLKLGFDTYSLRAFKWKSLQFLDYAASLKLDAIQISSLEDFESLDPGHLRQVRAKAERLGITIDAGTGCICPLSRSWLPSSGSGREAMLQGLRAASIVGAKSMRCVMGSMTDRRTTGSGPTLEACMEETIKIFRSVKSEAQDLNVKIALENHSGDMQAREVLAIIKESGPEFVGSCLDTGNPVWVMENPVVTMEILGPHVLTSHVRDSAIFEHPLGAAGQWVALGDGNVDLPAIIALHAKLCPQAAVNLEIITGRPPQILPYFDQTFWRWFEKMPGSEFVRFAELAKNGHPFMGVMTIEDAAAAKKLPEFSAALREQQRIDLERSFEYAKHTLGVGMNWRQA
ncbi:MAG TPA: sugar phosphate isomerase/epimerase [Bryobacteraceae bacterium]|jgi:sugar phosphate isomerase/epimerase